MYKDACDENLPIIGSDHGPILISMDRWNPKGKYPPFRSEKWLLKESFMMLVQHTWEKYIKGSYVYQLPRKIEFLKMKLKFR